MVTLEEIFHGYGLLIGMTSYSITNGKYHQSRKTQAYAVLLNIGLISTLPFLFWDISKGIMESPLLPGIMFIVPFILYMVNYVVIAYILISRFCRDSMLIDLNNLTQRLTRKMERTESQTSLQLRRLMHLKTFTFTYVTFGSVMSLLFVKRGFLQVFLVNIGYSIPNLSTYFYFVSFWQIARGYDFVNQQMEKINRAGSRRTIREEIRNLWFLHSAFSRMAHRINRIYGLQMLVSRLDYITFTIIYGYVGMIVLHEGITLFALHASSIYLVRAMDFFLNDFICELSIRYQCQPRDELSEGIMSQELSDYLIYRSTLRLNLTVCGLYPVNRNQWLQMIGFIISSTILLLQFYLILSDDNTEGL